MKNTIIKIVATIIVICGIAIIQNQNSSTNTITLGGLFNITGYAGFAGESSKNGFLMAVEDYGLSDNSVRVVIEDAQSDLKSAVSGATKLVEMNKAIVVIGPEWTEFGEVVSPIASKHRVPFISPWIVAEAPFVKPPYFWSAFPSDRVEHTKLLEYLSTNNYKRVALVFSNNYWSKTNTDVFKEEAKKNGSVEIISEYTLDQNTRDFRTVITKIKSDNPDIVYVAIGEDEGHGAFISQARQLGLTIPIGANVARAGSLVMKEKYPNLLYDQVFAQMLPSPKLKEFEDKYEKRFGKKPEAPSAAVSYDMTMIFLGAIKSGAHTSDQIISHLYSMDPYDGYSGVIAFDQNGQLPARTAVVKKYNKQNVLEEI
jgi:branched-chain amino acid transport system substrate-binding protein